MEVSLKALAQVANATDVEYRGTEYKVIGSVYQKNEQGEDEIRAVGVVRSDFYDKGTKTDADIRAIVVTPDEYEDFIPGLIMTQPEGEYIILSRLSPMYLSGKLIANPAFIICDDVFSYYMQCATWITIAGLPTTEIIDY